LTMIHEVMVLDNSGIDLAFINLSVYIKIAVFSSLIAGLVIPSNINIISAFIIYGWVLSVIAITIATIESLMARLRLTHVPQFILSASSIALIVLAVFMIGKK
ncbi:formate hydrogenlyase subunit 4, partial [Candidatus Magnetoovum chiemensis]